MHQMKLSIITINFNNASGLKKTVDSVVSQDFTDYEWIVIDGGSTDGSKELIEQYSSFISFWVSEPDKGIYNAMNKGVSHASGEYLLFLNSGDWLASDHVLEEVFSGDCSADIIYGNLFLQRSEKKMEEHRYPDAVSYMYMVRHSLPHPASFIKRELLLENPYDESLTIVSDWKFCLESVMADRSFKHIDSFVSVFDMNGISSTCCERDRREREKVISDLCPSAIAEDILIGQELEDYLGHTELQSFIQLRKSHRILGRLMTLCISTMKFVDKFTGKCRGYR